MNVLISGSGIAGPTLAWFLARTGARVTVLEKAPSLLSIGQNIDIQGSALRVVDMMGLKEEILRFNTTEKGTQLIDDHGKPFAPFPVRPGSVASPTSEFEILRGDLAKVLYNATKDLPNVEYRFGTTIKEILRNDEDAVSVQLSTGETQHYDLLVAADGQWSRTRKQAFALEDVQTRNMGAYIIYWTMPRVPGDNDWWNVYPALKSRNIATRPDPYGTLRGMFTFMPTSDAQKAQWAAAARDDRETQHALVRKEFADAGWQVERFLDGMEHAEDYYFQDLQQIKMSRWSTGRVVCVGDAAYAPTPLTGMGTPLAILGSYVLAGELSKLGRDGRLDAAGAHGHPKSALDAYDRVLRPFVDKIQDVPWWVPGIMHPYGRFKRYLLTTGMAAMSWVARTPFLIDRLQPANDADDFVDMPTYPIFEQMDVEGRSS